MNRPGWQTTEFWTTMIGQVLSLLTIVGVLKGADAATLQDALGKCITAIVVLVANSWVVVRYIQSRTRLKESGARTAGALPFILLPWLMLALAGTLPAPVGTLSAEIGPASSGR